MASGTLVQEQEAALPTSAKRAGKYLVFQVHHEEFGMNVLSVSQIMGMQDITTVPHTPSYIKGVINVRGKVIPVVDLRLKFGLNAAEQTQSSCIIIVEVKQRGTSVQMGIIVDSVAEVLNLAAADIQNTPDFGEGIETPYLLGVAKVKDKVKILIDIEQILNTHDLQGLHELTA